MDNSQLYRWLGNFRSYVAGRKSGNKSIYVTTLDEEMLERIEKVLESLTFK